MVSQLHGTAEEPCSQREKHFSRPATWNKFIFIQIVRMFLGVCIQLYLMSSLNI